MINSAKLKAVLNNRRTGFEFRLGNPQRITQLHPKAAEPEWVASATAYPYPRLTL